MHFNAFSWDIHVSMSIQLEAILFRVKFTYMTKFAHYSIVVRNDFVMCTGDYNIDLTESGQATANFQKLLVLLVCYSLLKNQQESVGQEALN